MKRNLMILMLVFAVGFSSCKEDLADRFANPDQLGGGVTDIVPGLFTQALTNNKLFIQDYGEWYYLLNGGTSITGYAQIAQRYISYRYSWFSEYNDLASGNGFDDYPITGQGYFEASYQRLKNLQVATTEANTRTGQAKADADIYVKLLTLMKYYQTGKLVDFFNSVPYFNAYQGSNGGSDYWYPAYDDPKAIYEDIIKGLGNMADSLPIAFGQMSAIGKGILATQDIAFKGDMDKWVRFANATRLKLLVRIAAVDGEFAKPLIQETLGRDLPVSDITFPLWYDTDLKDGGGMWLRGLYENSYASFIPNIIMKRLNYGDSTYNEGIDDPRLPVIAMPTKYGDYRGVSLNIPAQDKVYNAGDKYYPYADDVPSSLSTNSKSMYNQATLTRQNAMPVYMFSLGELDLLLAEIELKGWGSTGKTAQEHIKDEVIHSTNYWYALNQASNFKEDADAKGAAGPLYPTKPSDASIAAWGDKVAAKFAEASSTDDKMEILMQQKYIHLNILHPYELWTELRRTGHPKLEPFTWQSDTWKPFPERVRYPGAEQTTNPTKFAKVSAENNTTSKIFWVPADRNTSLYWDNYNYQ